MRHVLLLGIDTSAAITVGIIRGGTTLAALTRHEPRRHAELTAPIVSEALETAQVARGELEAIAVGVGPGPFTGLRIGLVTAQVIGYALGIPVYGVPSMDALALAGRDHDISGEIITLCDARRGEVYWARYRAGETAPYAGPDVAKLAELDLTSATAIGRMAPTTSAEIASGLLDPQGANIARLVRDRLAAGQTHFPTQPLYLRRPHVQFATQPKRATPQS